MPTGFRDARAARFIRLVLALVALAALASCYPGDQLTTEEADVVVTLFDESADFSVLRSYAMPDSIVHLVGEGDDTISRDFDDEILSLIVSNMGALGFTREGDPANADVIMLTAVAVNEQVGYAGYPWGGYWGWYAPYPPNFGWGFYPWYGASTIYTYRTGTIFMQMLDPARIDSTVSKVPTIWVGALNGLVQGDAVPERIADGINQAFAQSPYLGEGK